MARQLVKTVGLALVVPVGVVVAWIIAASVSPSPFWPSPLRILEAIPDTWFTGRITTDVVPTLWRLLAGYAMALALGISFGVLIGSSRRLRLFFDPVRDLLRAIPPTVLVPVVMIFAGIGDWMKVLVITWGCLWSILLNTTEGVRSIDEVQIHTAQSYRISNSRRLWRVILPAAAPQIMVGARQALSVGLIMTVISEMFAASNGIGFNIVQFQRTFAIPEMWTGMLLLGLIGVCANGIFKLVEKHVVLPWHYRMQRIV